MRMPGFVTNPSFRRSAIRVATAANVGLFRGFIHSQLFFMEIIASSKIGDFEFRLGADEIAPGWIGYSIVIVDGKDEIGILPHEVEDVIRGLSRMLDRVDEERAKEKATWEEEEEGESQETAASQTTA